MPLYIPITGAICTMVFSFVHCADRFLEGPKQNKPAAMAWFISGLGWLAAWIALVSKI